MWTQIQRLVRHRVARGWQHFLAESGLQRLTDQVAQCEKTHSGEIRLCIESSLPQGYLLRRQRAIELVADRGIASRVPPEAWARIVEGLRTPLQQGRFEEGLCEAVQQVSALLQAHFPLAPGEANPDELPDRPDVR